MAGLDTAPAIGIDLGTTYSAVAVVQHGKVKIIKNELGISTTPSYVAFTDYEILIGEPAKKQCFENPTNTIYDAKRLIGRKFYDENIQQDMRNWPFKVINRAFRPKIEVNYKGEQKEYSAKEISAIIIRYMKKIAEEYLNQTITHAVITVPANFKTSQRQETRDAARMAGLHVLQILNEPTAAAIAYKYKNRNNEKEQDKGKRHVLVYDLGGGTFDLSILEMENYQCKVLTTLGDTHLGGEDFDNRLIDFVIKKSEEKYSPIIRNDVNALQSIKVNCEQEKRILSAAECTSIKFRLSKGINFSITLTRSQFNKINADLFEKTLDTISQALHDVNLRRYDIDEIVLVGGSTRIPKIRALVKEFFDGKNPNVSIEPEKAIAYGAAVQAAILHGAIDVEMRGMRIQDVTPYSLGTEINEEKMDVIIKRNLQIPLRETREYQTLTDNQDYFTMNIYEGESEYTAENAFLGEFRLSDIPPAPAGKSFVSFTFEIDKNGILSATARSGEKNERTLKIENLDNRVQRKNVTYCYKT